jgi:Raf kinase inhibitor-like YbhB/YbcL family protein
LRFGIAAAWLASLMLATPISAQPESDARLSVSTPAFAPGGPMSWRYTCYNANEPSPPLDWSGVPDGIASLAVLMDAPEHPAGINVHWLLFNLPPDLTSLPEAIPKTESLDNGALQGRNDFGKIGFSAPCPPVLTTAIYRITLYALDQMLDLPSGTSGSAFTDAIAGHVLTSGEISGNYLRPAWPWG